jgi:hypothetical protein
LQEPSSLGALLLPLQLLLLQLLLLLQRLLKLLLLQLAFAGSPLLLLLLLQRLLKLLLLQLAFAGSLQRLLKLLPLKLAFAGSCSTNHPGRCNAGNNSLPSHLPPMPSGRVQSSALDSSPLINATGCTPDKSGP